MKNKLLLFLLSIIFSAQGFAQELPQGLVPPKGYVPGGFVPGKLWVKIEREEGLSKGDPSVWMNNEDLQNLFEKNKVYSFKRAFPIVDKFEVPYKFGLDSVYEILCKCDENKLMEDIKQLNREYRFYGYIEKEPVPMLCSTPNDYNLQNGNPISGPDSAGNLIHIQTAWNYSKGHWRTRLGVNDCNLSQWNQENGWHHEDIYGKIVFWDTLSPGSWRNDFHGLFVSGIVAGATNNGKGKASAGYNCSILFSSHMGSANALLLLSQQGARAINCSWMTNSYSQTMQNTINLMDAHGTLVVAAVGNDPMGSPPSWEYQWYPASYNKVLAVTSVNYDYHFMRPNGYHHNYNTRVDVCAPGYYVLSLWDSCQTCYKRSSGTSFATPLVTGVAGLIFALNPKFTPAQVKYIIRATANDTIYQIPANLPYLGKLGTGSLDAGAALKYAKILSCDIVRVDPIDINNWNVNRRISNHLTITPDTLYFYDFNAQSFSIINNTGSVDTLVSVNTGSNPANVPPVQIGDMYLMHNGDSTLVVLDTTFGFGHPQPMQPGDTVKVYVSVLIPQKSIDSTYYVEKMQIISSNSTIADTAYVLIDKNAQNWLMTDQVKSTTFKVYPNPANSMIYIRGENPERVEIYSLTGEKVRTVPNSNHVDVSDLPNGLYTMRILGKQGVSTLKMSVLHH